MALKRRLEINKSVVLIAGRGRFTLLDVGPRGFGVGAWITDDAPPRMVAVCDSVWTMLAADVSVRLAPRKHPPTGGASNILVTFAAPPEVLIRQHDGGDVPMIYAGSDHDED